MISHYSSDQKIKWSIDLVRFWLLDTSLLTPRQSFRDHYQESEESHESDEETLSLVVYLDRDLTQMSPFWHIPGTQTQQYVEIDVIFIIRIDFFHFFHALRELKSKLKRIFEKLVNNWNAFQVFGHKSVDFVYSYSLNH